MSRPLPDLPAAATMTVPGWLWGGDPVQFFTEAALRARPAGGDVWRVQTEERYRRTRPSLISVEHLTGPGAPGPRLDRLTDAAASSFLPDLGGAFPAEVAEVRRRADRDPRPDRHGVELGLPDPRCARGGTRGDRCRRAPGDDRHPPLGSDPAQRPLARAGVHLVRRAPELVHRAKLAAVLLQAEHSPALMTDELQHQLRAASEAGELVFAASQHLFDGLVLGDAYLGPLLGALTPHVWAFAAHRPLGAIVYSVGTVLLGTPGRATELLHLLPSQGARHSTPRPPVPVTAAAAALDWWSARLNDLCGVLIDPAIFTDRQQRYHPAKHLQALLTVEQLFRRVSSIQTTHRDTNARRVLMFSVLDTLHRLTGREIEVLCDLGRAHKRLNTVASSMSSDAATILLPAARRAIEALRQTQDGLYLRHHHGSAHVEIPAPEGGQAQTLTPEKAAAEYIKVLRNSTHGHGSNKSARVELTNALLAHHTGDLPHDLALLGYLYLLDILVHPHELALRLYGGGAA